jgi:predicted nucleic acid-binding protein
VPLIYLDTSAVLRATLESGTTPDLEAQVSLAEAMLTSRLSLVEASRSLIRAQQIGRVSEKQRVDAERQIDSIFARCHVWEISRAVCERASSVAPRTGLRTLDAIHLATLLEARRRTGAEIELLTADERLASAYLAL